MAPTVFIVPLVMLLRRDWHAMLGYAKRPGLIAPLTAALSSRLAGLPAGVDPGFPLFMAVGQSSRHVLPALLLLLCRRMLAQAQVSPG